MPLPGHAAALMVMSGPRDGRWLTRSLIFAVRESAIGLLATFGRLERMAALHPLLTYRMGTKRLVLSASGE